jgi:excisionase family DNA binding protein
MTDRLLTADQLADRWQVPRSQVYALSRQGRIPTVRLGKYYRYRLEVIEDWERGVSSSSTSADIFTGTDTAPRHR